MVMKNIRPSVVREQRIILAAPGALQEQKMAWPRNRRIAHLLWDIPIIPEKTTQSIIPII